MSEETLNPIPETKAGPMTVAGLAASVTARRTASAPPAEERQEVPKYDFGGGDGDPGEGGEDGEEQVSVEPQKAKANLPDELVQAIREAGLDGGLEKLTVRLHKVVDDRDQQRNQRLALQEQLEEAQAKIRELEGGGAKPAGRKPTSDREMAGHPEMVEIDTTIDTSERLIRWARQHPDGGPLPVEGGETVDVDEDTVQVILDTENRKLAQALAKREVRLESLKARAAEEEKKAVERAREIYPWLADPKSEEFKLGVECVESFSGGIQSNPDWRLWIADAVAGRRARLAAGKVKATSPGLSPRREAPASEPTHQPSTPGARRAGASSDDLEEATEAYQKTGSVNAFARMLSAKRRAA